MKRSDYHRVPQRHLQPRSSKHRHKQSAAATHLTVTVQSGQGCDFLRGDEANTRCSSHYTCFCLVIGSLGVVGSSYDSERLSNTS